jgi:molybdopterin-guanine dinucleotide biosynthesis protein A
MNGLIIAGGSSTRMGHNKAFLDYGNLPQYKAVEKLLLPFCTEIYISLKAPNASIAIPQLIDAHTEIGPISAFASAYQQAKTNWLIVAIDYPLLVAKDITHLVNTFRITNTSCVYYNMASAFYEPYIGIYTSTYLEIIMNQLNQHQFSLQKILAHFPVEKVIASHIKNIISVDTMEQYLAIKHK